MERTIPFFNYFEVFERHRADYLRIFDEVCSRGAFIMQKDLSAFEEALAAFLHVKHAIGVADGTNALMLGLRAMEIGIGDEVIVPSHTFVASVASIHLVGATPILADCGADHLVDPVSVESLVSARTKAIMPVHLNGRTCAMDALAAVAQKHGLQIIEDAAQGLGSTFRGKHAGTFGACGTFSFYPAKSLGCFGDGGAVVTNDSTVADRLRQLRDHGRASTGAVECWGTNSRLDNLQAAFLHFKLMHFEGEITRRREIAGCYHKALSSIDDLTLPPSPEDDIHFDCFQNYELESGRRDELRSFLASRGIGTLIQWGGKAVHQHEALRFKHVTLPKTELLFQRCFMLPMNTSLSDDDVDYVCQAVREFYGVG